MRILLNAPEYYGLPKKQHVKGPYNLESSKFRFGNKNEQLANGVQFLLRRKTVGAVASALVDRNRVLRIGGRIQEVVRVDLHVVKRCSWQIFQICGLAIPATGRRPG